jgi:hypothetical protein
MEGGDSSPRASLPAGANPHKGETSLSLGGVDYILRPDFERLAMIEAKCGAPLVELYVKLAQRQLLLTDLRELLSWAIASPAAPDDEALGPLLLEAGIDACTAALILFIGAGLNGGRIPGDEDGDESAGEGEAAAGTDTPSAASSASPKFISIGSLKSSGAARPTNSGPGSKS